MPHSPTAPTPSRSGRSTPPATSTRPRPPSAGRSTPPLRSVTIDSGPSGLTNDRHPDLRLQLRSPASQLRMLDRHRNPATSAPALAPNSHTPDAPLADGALHLPGPGDRRRRQSRNRDAASSRSIQRRLRASTDRHRSRLSGEPQLAQGHRQRSGRINGPPLHDRRLLGHADRDDHRGGTGDGVTVSVPDDSTTTDSGPRLLTTPTIHPPARQLSPTSRTRALRRPSIDTDPPTLSGAPRPASPSRAPTPAAPASPPSNAAATAHRLPPAPRRRPMPHSPTAPIPSRSGRSTAAGNVDQTPASFSWIDRHRRADHEHRLEPAGAEQRRLGQLRLLGDRRRRLRRRLVRMPPRRRIVCALHLAAGLCRTRRRRPYLRGPGDRPAGNVDQTPASFSWTIDTAAPTTNIDSSPPALTNAASASFAFSGTDAGGSGVASFECRIDSTQAADWWRPAPRRRATRTSPTAPIPSRSGRSTPPATSTRPRPPSAGRSTPPRRPPTSTRARRR